MPGLIDFIIPREKKFFNHLYDQVIVLSDCIKKLKSFSQKDIKNEKKRQAVLRYITNKRDKCGDISKEVINSLHQTFITPIDRGEIKTLSHNIYLVTNSVKKIAENICFFKVEEIDECLVQQLACLQKASRTLAFIFHNPLSLKENRERIDTIKKIEGKADDFYRRGIEYLFANGCQPIEVIKRRDLYEVTEEAIDKIDNIADIWETVLINHA